LSAVDARDHSIVDSQNLPRTANGQGVSAMTVHENQYLAVGTELESEGPGDVAVYIW